MSQPAVHLHSLKPSKEKLDMLSSVDWASFSESESSPSQKNPTLAENPAFAETATLVRSRTCSFDSDDPFDSKDLDGLLAEPPLTLNTAQSKVTVSQVLTSSASPKPSSSDSKNNKLPSPKECLDSLAESSPRKSQRELSMKPKLLDYMKPPSPPVSAGNTIHAFKTPSMISPTRDASFKKAKLDRSPVVANYYSQVPFRQFSTNNIPSLATNSMSPQHPTIQMATQKTFGFENQRDYISLDSDEDADFEQLRQKRVKATILSKEQNHILSLAKKGKSLFFTGCAGTGKSVLLKAIIKDLRASKPPGSVAVTASTGMAACGIGGTTVHSFAGIGLGKGDVPTLVKTVRRNKKAVAKWRETQVLVIDEISMIDGKLFDKLDMIAREIRRRKNVPFGGIQIIVCGDFYQLPPVSKTEINADGSETKEQALFAFESAAWQEALSSSFVLKEVFRQKGDQKFIDMLNDMRHGIVSEEADHEFTRLSRPLRCPQGIEPTELFATRSEVERANNSKLVRLNGRSKTYEAKDGGSLPPSVRATWLSNFLAPQKLFLKENAQVMCLKNFDDRLVNGSLGKVIGFVDRNTYLRDKILQENPDLSAEEKEKLLIKHKIAFKRTQDTSKEVSVADVTEEEVQEVLSSQMKSDHVFGFMAKAGNTASTEEETLTTEQMTTEQLVEHNRKRKLTNIEKNQQASDKEELPLVRFLGPDGVTTRDVLIEPERWEITDDKTGDILVSRVQFPLMLAWAISIHKSQGQTIPNVKVDLSKIFENGQAYVALSRAVSREGLQVLNFRRERVRTNQTVENFYSTLLSTDD